MKGSDPFGNLFSHLGGVSGRAGTTPMPGAPTSTSGKIIEFDDRTWFVLEECASIVGGVYAVEIDEDDKAKYGSVVHLVRDEEVYVFYKRQQRWTEDANRMRAVVDAQPATAPKVQGFALRGRTAPWLAVERNPAHDGNECVAHSRILPNQAPANYDPDVPLCQQLCEDHARMLIEYEAIHAIIDTTAESMPDKPSIPPTGVVKLGGTK